MLAAYFEGLARGVADKLAATGDGAPRARKTLTLELARLGGRLFAGDQSVAWCGVLAPFDLLAAMGVTSAFVEFVGAMLASTGRVAPLLAEAEQAGYSTDSCSYHRAVLGAAGQGLIPRPDFLLATSVPCAGGLAVLENLARQFDRPLRVLDVPQRDDPAAVDYLAGQLADVAEWVAGITGRPLEPARLATAIEHTNRARELLLEVYQLAAAVPSPVRPRDLINFGIVVSLLLGTEAAVRVAEVYRDELAATRAAHPDAPREPARLMWLQNRVQFRSGLEELLAELGGVVVVDELNSIRWGAIDPADPFPGLARRMLSIPLTGAIEQRLENLAQLARDYQVDGAINPCHWGCRQGTGARGLIADRLGAIGVPVVNLEVDCIDPRNYAPGQLRTRLEAFLEMIHGAAAPRGES